MKTNEKPMTKNAYDERRRRSRSLELNCVGVAEAISPERKYKKWLTSEVLTTMREYDLLEMPIAEIAKVHKRSEASIVAILKEEGMMM